MMVNKKIIGGVAALGTAGIVAGVVYVSAPASASDPRRAPAASQAQTDQGRERMRPRRAVRGVRGVHGEATVRRKAGFVRITWQRGRVTAVSGRLVTVRSPDAVTWQWTTDKNTRVRRHGEKTELSTVATGDWAVVLGRLDGNTRRAALVRIPKQAPSPSPSPS